MCPKPFLALWLLLLCTLAATAQKNRPKLKFGDVKPEDFAPTAYAVDSSAEAVYLFDAGNASFEGNNKGFLSVISKRHARIRLLHKNAFDLATVEIKLFGKDKDAQRLDQLEAATYNLEDGKVVVTKLDKNSVFRDKNPDYSTAKFTFPNIREGSIIEFDYAVINPGFSYIPAWLYQGEYPRLYSEYDVTIPSLLDFAFVRQGYHPYMIDTAKIAFGSYNILEPGSTAMESATVISWKGNTINSIWAMKDVPALKKEAFTTTLSNHIAKIEFQLSAIRLPELPVKNVMRTWPDMAADLMKDEEFGAGLSAHNGWLSDELKKIQEGATDSLARAHKIFEYVRDNFTCTDEDAIYLSQSLKKVFQSKKGNVADINLLLTAMLRNQGWDARPVLLSTREHGVAMETYPILNKFNYVISRLCINNKYYLLDAAQPSLGFGKLSGSCYNGSGRIINADEPILVPLSPDSLTESRITTVFLMNDSASKIAGSYACMPGYYESVKLRQKLRKEKQETFFNDIKKGFSYDISLFNSGVDSLTQMDEPVSYRYEMKFDFNNDDLVYFNPLIGERYKENPFKSSERYYPVEMPYCIDRLYVFNMEIPKGYKVDELPKSAKVNLNETEGTFEYMIGATAERVQLRCRVKLNKANFLPDDYQTLRDFFSYVVKKESEQIVFKKIK